MLCDFDFRHGPSLRPFWAVCRIVGLRIKRIRLDRTARGWHTVLYIQESLTPSETVALQAILGSDDRREALNLMRVIAIRQRDPGGFWRDRWNLLFSEKLRK